jgi:hypothetical protein
MVSIDNKQILVAIHTSDIMPDEKKHPIYCGTWRQIEEAFSIDQANLDIAERQDLRMWVVYPLDYNNPYNVRYCLMEGN